MELGQATDNVDEPTVHKFRIVTAIDALDARVAELEERDERRRRFVLPDGSTLGDWMDAADRAGDRDYDAGGEG